MSEPERRRPRQQSEQANRANQRVGRQFGSKVRPEDKGLANGGGTSAPRNNETADETREGSEWMHAERRGKKQRTRERKLDQRNNEVGNGSLRNPTTAQMNDRFSTEWREPAETQRVRRHGKNQLRENAQTPIDGNARTMPWANNNSGNPQQQKTYGTERKWATKELRTRAVNTDKTTKRLP